MVYWKWTSDMEIGVEQIDSLQRDLTNCANRLFEALATGQPLLERFGDLLLKLDRACSFSEELEEELQLRFEGRVEKARPAHHRDFERRIGRLLERHQADQDVSLETLQLLADWLAYHQALGLGAWRGLIKPLAPREPQTQHAVRLNH